MSREGGGKGVYCIVIFRYFFMVNFLRKSKFMCVAFYEDASIAAMYVHLISGWIFYSSKMQRKQKSWIQVELSLAKEDVYVW